MLYRTLNPATGELLKEYPELSAADAHATLEHAHTAQKLWRNLSYGERGDRLRKVAALLREDAESLARLMATEMGKPLAQGKAEAEKCAWVCEYFADTAEGFLADEAIETELAESFTTTKPLGVVFAVMPWNFPFWQVFRAAAPALMAGNGFAIKHAPNVPQCAAAIEDLVVRGGLPEGLMPNLYVTNEVAAELIGSPHVHGVTLTGSTRAGRAVAATAGQHLKKTVLELGGSDPYLVLEDADIELAATACATSRLLNGGQSCIAAKRFLVVDSVYDAFLETFVEKMHAAVMGDPFTEGTTLGPMARIDLRDELARQVDASVAAGATAVIGGSVPEGNGAFYPATVLTGVRPGMTAFDEELFGPVASVVRVADETEAVELANQSAYGLGGAVFTKDTDHGRRLARDVIETGTCAVNDFVRSDPRLPFGGILDSGYGRELGRAGIQEFTNLKTIVVGR